MSTEAIGAMAGLPPTGGAAATRSVDQLPLADVGSADKFSLAMDRAASAAPSASGDMPAPVQSMLKVLDSVDVQARSVSDYAKQAELSGGSLTPGEIVNLTMRCQEFMFQCQLTSNIANRSSDGLQQLFRQQG